MMILNADPSVRRRAKKIDTPSILRYNPSPQPKGTDRMAKKIKSKTPQKLSSLLAKTSVPCDTKPEIIELDVLES